MQEPRGDTLCVQRPSAARHWQQRGTDRDHFCVRTFCVVADYLVTMIMLFMTMMLFMTRMMIRIL